MPDGEPGASFVVGHVAHRVMVPHPATLTKLQSFGTNQFQNRPAPFPDRRSRRKRGRADRKVPPPIDDHALVFRRVRRLAF
ncbi:hypothetical protein GCM10010399_88610 [Dactylosporangium fulvum]